MSSQAQDYGSQAVVRNCHVDIPYTANSRIAASGFVCLDAATLDLQQCTVVASPVSGSIRVSSLNDASLSAELVCGVVMHGPGAGHCTQPSTVRMTDCKLSFQLPDAASAAGIGAASPSGYAVSASEGSRLEANRCTFSGFGLDLKSHAGVHLTECTIEDNLGRDEGEQGWHMGLLCRLVVGTIR